jgi:NAD(P)-dependent dehydrogenase (short-subunit alcohol dehydrogenase family)
MACRSVEKAQLAVSAVMPHATRGGRAEPAVLDLGSLASVRTFAEEFLESGAPLDVLVCNAVSTRGILV